MVCLVVVVNYSLAKMSNILYEGQLISSEPNSESSNLRVQQL